jgi:hypothetical protein
MLSPTALKIFTAVGDGVKILCAVGDGGKDFHALSPMALKN